MVCTAGACDVTLERTGTGSDELAGVKLVFRNATGAAGTDNPVDMLGDVPLLVGSSEAGVASGLATPTSVEVTVFFKDASENEQLCSQTTTFNF